MDRKSTYAPLFSMPDSGWQPERTLWVCVVGQAVIDAASTDPVIREEVVQWLADEDFLIVCDMAGMNAAPIRRLVTGILNEDDPKRAFRAAMNFRFMLRSFLESQMGEADKEGLTPPPRT